MKLAKIFRNKIGSIKRTNTDTNSTLVHELEELTRQTTYLVELVENISIRENKIKRARFADKKNVTSVVAKTTSETVTCPACSKKVKLSSMQSESGMFVQLESIQSGSTTNMNFSKFSHENNSTSVPTAPLETRGQK